MTTNMDAFTLSTLDYGYDVNILKPLLCGFPAVMNCNLKPRAKISPSSTKYYQSIFITPTGNKTNTLMIGEYTGLHKGELGRNNSKFRYLKFFPTHQ